MMNYIELVDLNCCLYCYTSYLDPMRIYLAWCYFANQILVCLSRCQNHLATGWIICFCYVVRFYNRCSFGQITKSMVVPPEHSFLDLEQDYESSLRYRWWKKTEVSCVPFHSKVSWTSQYLASQTEAQPH